MEPFMELSGFGGRDRADRNAAVTNREQHIQSALRAYKNSSWGRAVADSDQAAGLCKRASLVLLELLNREGIEDAALWHLGMPKEGRGFARSDEHYVVVIGAEAIDVTARQFDATCDPVTRRSLAEVKEPWQVAQPVRIGWVEPLIGTDLHDIPSNWRELADVDPPGEAIGWPYPGGWPTPPRAH
jgi:hypothetical protein